MRCWHKLCTPIPLSTRRGCWPSTVDDWSGQRTTWGRNQGYWTGLHLIGRTTGICNCSYWGMDHWPWCTWPPWWFLQCCALPTHNGEVVHPGVMACGVGMVINRRRDPEMFLEPFPKGLCRFSCVLLITLQPVTHVPVNYFTHLYDIIPILGGHQEVFEVLPSLKWTWTPILPQMFLKLWHH